LAVSDSELPGLYVMFNEHFLPKFNPNKDMSKLGMYSVIFPELLKQKLGETKLMPYLMSRKLEKDALI
jgi:hypothetical protein